MMKKREILHYEKIEIEETEVDLSEGLNYIGLGAVIRFLTSGKRCPAAEMIDAKMFKI